ncbi:MAG: hypothetical protein Q9163_006295 [Psora crenata]
MSGKCQRCAEGGRECVYALRSNTRRRKRTDTRVKELEEKVRSLSLLLEKGRNGSNTSPAHTSTHAGLDDNEGMHDEREAIGQDEVEDDEISDYDGTAAFNGTDRSRRRTQAANGHRSRGFTKSTEPQSQSGLNATSGSTEYSSDTAPDVIERGLLTLEEATELFVRYVEVLSPNHPVIVFAPGTSAAEVRSKRPILFLAAIAASAGAADPALNLKLNKEILQVYATKVALQGRKSLDLVQSIIISSLWYYPPERFDQLKFHQYIHMAATMALDLGLAKRPRTRGQRDRPKTLLMQNCEPQSVLYHDDSPAAPATPAPDSSSIECRRTLLACYLQCATVSMSLRLPNALRFTSYMAECLDVLETSPDAAPTDRRLAAWIRIQRIVEECVDSFSLDDAENTASLAEGRVQALLRGYEKQMEAWGKTLKPGTLNPCLEINFHVNNVYIHEIGLHPDHDPDDFRPPYYIAKELSSKIPAVMNPAYVHAIMECVSSAQRILTIFLCMNIIEIRALPALLYVRVTYSCIVLIKLEISSSAPGSELGRVLDRDSLDIASRLDKVLKHQMAVVGSEGRNILAAKFLLIFKRLISWYNQYRTQGFSGGEFPEGLEPGLAINPENQLVVTSNQLIPSKLVQRGVPKDYTIPVFGNRPTNAPQAFPQTMYVRARAPAPAPAPPGQRFSASFSAVQVTPTTAALGRPMQQAPFEVPQAMLTYQNGSPPLDDYCSPDYYPTGVGGERSGSNSTTPPMVTTKMEVDPRMFEQLQGIGEPFTYNGDPNDWMYDEATMGDDGMGLGDLQLPDF